MNENDELDRIVGQIYEAAINPDLWRPALLDFGRWIGSSEFHFYAWDQNEGRARVSLVSNDHYLDTMQQWEAYYSKVDPIRPKAVAVAPGQFFVVQEHFDRPFVEKNEFFQDFLIRNGVCWSIGGTAPVEEGVHTVLGMLRAHDRGGYSREELERARRVWGHFTRANALFVQTEQLRRRAVLGESGLDQMEIAVLALDGQGRVLYANRQAEAIVRSSAEVAVKQGVFTASDGNIAHSLREALQRAARRGHSSSIPVLDRSGRGEDLYLTVAPIQESATLPSLLCRPSAIILLRRRNHQRMLTESQLRQLFGLSPAEARLARRLAHGKTVEDCASETGISVATARSQLRKVLEKTSTNRQSELVRLLVSLPASRIT
ncbi:MAG: PAS domain-containing protein [Betaproteobacteria bacterium]|nr:PAS domain-containing protein [Betaproteobacteria bacterium]